MSNRLHPISELHNRPVDTSLILPGISLEPESKFTTLPVSGIIYTPMNAARHTRVTRDTIGQVYTTGLGGCTGIAAFAKTTEGSLLGVSHFDPVVDSITRLDGVSPSERFIRQFTRIAHHLGADAIEACIAYDELQKNDPAYSQRDQMDPSATHYLASLEELAAAADEGTHIDFVPYQGLGVGHTLAVNADLDAAISIEFQ